MRRDLLRTFSRGVLASAFAVAMLLPVSKAAAQQTIYWTDDTTSTVGAVYYATTVPVSSGGGLTGAAVYSTGTPINGPFENPEGIGVDSSGNVFVATNINTAEGQVIVGDAVSYYVEEVPVGSTPGTGNSETIYTSSAALPYDLAVTSSGNIYFTTNGTTGKIVLLKPAGPPYTATNPWASSTTFSTDLSPGGYWSPLAVALDSQGNLYMSDSLTTGGNASSDIIKMPATTTSPASMSLFASATALSATSSSQIMAVTLDASGDIWAADYGTGKVFEFSSAGTLLDTITGLSKPHGIAFDAFGDLWITESTPAAKILEYTISGSTATLAATVSGSGLGTSVNPQYLAFAPYSAPAGPNAWSGGANSTVWATMGNWSNNVVPGATSGTTSTDTALFNLYNANYPAPVVDSGRNVQNVTFDNTNGNLTGSIMLGTSTGNSLLLTSGGMVQTTSSVSLPQYVNAPLVLEGGGTYTFQSGATLSTATLNFGGPISSGAGSGVTTLALAGANAGANTISGAISDGGNGSTIAVAVQGGAWVFTAANSYSSGTTISSGATLSLSGSASSFTQSMSIVNAGSLVVTTSQQVGTITGTGGAVAANGGTLTAYQILQKSLTIGAGATVILSPSGSGSVGNPLGPNNTTYSSNVGSLSIAGGLNAWSGTLDIGNNGLVIQYGSGADPFATIENMVESGYNGGSWGGTGITSSLAQAATSGSHPLNIGLEDFTPNANGFGASVTFEGQTITTSAVLVRLTYMDDLELAGDMSQNDATNDALLFAANYGIGTTWSVGDVTHDGSINSNDALLFAANYFIDNSSTLDGTTGNALSLAGAAVPEPASVLLASFAAAGLGCWRFRRCRPAQSRPLSA